LSRLETARAMTMTVVEGTCSAVALELLLVSDRRLASPDFSMPRLGRGGDLWPGMSLYRLSRQIGESRARRFFLDPADVSAARCLTLDIVDDIVEGSGQSALVTGLMRFAPVQDLSIWRRLLQESTSTDFHEALAAHLVACDRALRRPTQRTPCDAPHDVVVGQ
jgi:isomerase DpgB